MQQGAAWSSCTRQRPAWVEPFISKEQLSSKSALLIPMLAMLSLTGGSAQRRRTIFACSLLATS